jgi:hypothetical protein
MKTQLSKLALTAALGLAIAFTFSCSSGDDENNNNGGGGSPVTGGADGGGNQFSQIYNGYYDNDVYHIGTAYNGSGVIKMLAKDEDDNEILINAGSVTNGKVNLNLPSTIPDDYLSEFFISNEYATHSCTDYTKDIKQFEGLLILTDDSGSHLGGLTMHYEEGPIFETIEYWYFTKAGKITCDAELSTRRDIVKIDAKVGWNKIYCHRNYADGNSTKECSTNNILTKEMKWTIQPE